MFRYLYLAAVSLLVTLKTGAAIPVETTDSHNGDFQLESIIGERDGIKAIDNALSTMEAMISTRVVQLLNKITSLGTMIDLLANGSIATPVIQHGTRGNTTSRCPIGFSAVAGDNMCYYFSNYKTPWSLAREYCLQRGPDIEPVLIDTTRHQFIITHLIQSDEELRKVKRWWTSGRKSASGGSVWTWRQRLGQEHLLFKFWKAESDPEAQKDMEQCMVLDAESYYQWRAVRCNQDTGSHPEHHFICQTKATQPTSSETRAYAPDHLVRIQQEHDLTKKRIQDNSIFKEQRGMV